MLVAHADTVCCGHTTRDKRYPHDAYTGLAMRPEWGPVNGSQAVSEQSLLEQAIHRLASGAVVLGDSNFGVFSVAYVGDQQGHPVLLRLTAVRTRHLAQGAWRDGIDQRVVWRPSRDDRRSHRDGAGRWAADRAVGTEHRRRHVRLH